MMLISKAFVLTALAAACSTASAQSITVAVTGKIRPGACTPTLTSEGAFDYSNISSDTLRSGGVTQLQERTANFAVKCSAPTKVGFRVIDNQPGTAAWVSLKAAGSDGHPAFGLGSVDGKNVGAYAMTMDSFQADGNPGTGLVSTNGSTWVSSRITGMGNNPSTLYSIAAASEAIPMAHTTFASILRVQASIDSAAKLPPLTGDVLLNGQATISLIYL
jgi:hypothetical protein